MNSDLLVDLLDPTEQEVREVLPASAPSNVTTRLAARPRADRVPRPRLEQHGDYVFGVLVVPHARPHRGVYYQEVDVVLDFDRIVVVRKTPDGGEPYDLTDLRAQCERGASPGLALYHLFNEIAEHFLDIVDKFNEEIDTIEDEVNTMGAEDLRDRLSELRHDVLHIRRTLSPTRDAARSVLDGRLDLEAEESEPELFPRDVELRFADAYDKLLRAVDGLDLSRDLIAGVRDYHQAKIANDQNEIMKRLTIVSSILLPPTFIVGLYGQNFVRMPELHWVHGYLFSWLLILGVTIGQVLYLKRRGWL